MFKKVILFLVVSILIGCQSEEDKLISRINELELINEQLNIDVQEITSNYNQDMAAKENQLTDLQERLEKLEKSIRIYETEVIVEDQNGNPIDISKLDYVGTFSNGDEVYIDGYTYNLIDAAWQMMIVRDGVVIKDYNYISKPVFNKDRTKILFVDSVQFEVIGNVVTYEAESMTEITYTDFGYEGTDMTVKGADWFSDDTVLCIIGYPFGTITQGGRLYHLDLNTRVLKEVYSNEMLEELFSDYSEIVKFNIEDRIVELIVVQWFENDLMEYYYIEHTVLIKDLDI